MAIILEFPNLRIRKGVFAVGACFSPRSDPFYLWAQEARRVQEIVAKARAESQRRRRALLAEEARLIRQKVVKELPSWFQLIKCADEPRRTNIVPLLRIVR
jgi:hypothetical protein